MVASISTRACAAIIAAAMACTLGFLGAAPQGAQAAEPAATPLTTQAASADDSLATQAAKKTVYLRTKMKSSSSTTKYSYNKKGLITKIAGNNDTWTFKYSGAKMVSATHKTKYSAATNTVKFTLKYDSKNHVKKITSKGSNNTDNYIETFTYNSKGQVKKMVKKNTSSGTTDTYKYAYNSKGRVVKTTSPIGTTTIKYDGKGYPKSASVVPPAGYYGIHRHFGYSNSYNSKGLVSKIASTMNGYSGTLTTTFAYAKKKVAKNYASVAKAQQRALLTTTPNSILPTLL